MIFDRPRNRRALIAASVTLLLAGCGSAKVTTEPADPAAVDTAAAGPSPGSAASGANGVEPTSAVSGAHTVTIEITDAGGCAVSPSSVPAGGVTFAISNVDATAVNEVHLTAGDRIRGERENLAPGFRATFSVTLEGGSYLIVCPGAKTESQPFTVTGESLGASGDLADLLDRAASDYADYVSAQAGFLVEATAALQKAVQAGNLVQAQRGYAKARPFYERIEPVAESFGGLDPDIDAREGDVPAADWKGFHPIERALFVDMSVAAARPYLPGLVADVGTLKKLTEELAAGTRAKNGKGYQPDEVANGAASLLEEVQKTKITGEEERYSHIDLVDFAANVEGSQQAFAALVPALDRIDPAVAPPISARFKALGRAAGCRAGC